MRSSTYGNKSRGNLGGWGAHHGCAFFQFFPKYRFFSFFRCPSLINSSCAWIRLVVNDELAISGNCSRNNTRSEEHTSELQSLMRISYAVFCLKKKNNSKL